VTACFFLRSRPRCGTNRSKSAGRVSKDPLANGRQQTRTGLAGTHECAERARARAAAAARDRADRVAHTLAGEVGQAEQVVFDRQREELKRCQHGR
jgi:hypothetical protein